MQRNFEKQTENARRILQKHKYTDLSLADMAQLITICEEQGTFEALTTSWLLGIAAGYELGKQDTKESK